MNLVIEISLKRMLLCSFLYKSRDYRTDVLEIIADIPRITRSDKNKINTGTTTTK